MVAEAALLLLPAVPLLVAHPLLPVARHALELAKPFAAGFDESLGGRPSVIWDLMQLAAPEASGGHTRADGWL